jgi:UDP-glucose 4-epimerase
VPSSAAGTQTERAHLDWPGTRALVTGATGFIGSHLVRRLVALGAEVHAVSRRTRVIHADEVTWHLADLRDSSTTAELIRDARPDVVFHLASMVTGARDVRLALPTLESNLASVVNVLTAAADAATARVVLAGSIEEPKRGRSDAIPPSPYAVAKWAATAYARMFNRLWGVPVTVLRVAMVYGPGQPDHTKLVPYVTLELLSGREPQVSSGTRLVDWVYVEDVVDAFVAAAESDRSIGQVLEIGTGIQVSIRDTVELLAKIVGGEARPRFGAIADRPMDDPQVADPGPAEELLGWLPTTSLADGLRATVGSYARELSG